MSKVKVCRVRPVAWKLYVQGADEARQLREYLQQYKLHVSAPSEEPTLSDPSLWSLLVNTTEEAPLTLEELTAVLEENEQVELQIAH